LALGMTAIRNAAALPLMALAITLWFLADTLAKLSQIVGDAAGRIMGQRL
jgi:hypothetical protein